jgi:hypothetical protein
MTVGVGCGARLTAGGGGAAVAVFAAVAVAVERAGAGVLVSVTVAVGVAGRGAVAVGEAIPVGEAIALALALALAANVGGRVGSAVGLGGTGLLVVVAVAGRAARVTTGVAATIREDAPVARATSVMAGRVLVGAGGGGVQAAEGRPPSSSPASPEIRSPASTDRTMTASEKIR